MGDNSKKIEEMLENPDQNQREKMFIDHQSGKLVVLQPYVAQANPDRYVAIGMHTKEAGGFFQNILSHHMMKLNFFIYKWLFDLTQ